MKQRWQITLMSHSLCLIVYLYQSLTILNPINICIFQFFLTGSTTSICVCCSTHQIWSYLWDWLFLTSSCCMFHVFTPSEVNQCERWCSDCTWRTWVWRIIFRLCFFLFSTFYYQSGKSENEVVQTKRKIVKKGTEMTTWYYLGRYCRLWNNRMPEIRKWKTASTYKDFNLQKQS